MDAAIFIPSSALIENADHDFARIAAANAPPSDVQAIQLIVDNWSHISGSFK